MNQHFKNCHVLSSGKRFRPSWRWAPALCSGSAESATFPSASAVCRPVTGCTLDTFAPDGPAHTKTHKLYDIWMSQTEDQSWKYKEVHSDLGKNISVSFCFFTHSVRGITPGKLYCYQTVGDFIWNVHMEILDLIAPEGQSTSTDVQNYIWSQTCQHHGFVVLRRWQLRPHDVQLSRQRGRAGRADGGGAAELARSVLIAENMRAGCDPGEAAQLSAALWEVTQEGVVADGHGHGYRQSHRQYYEAKPYLTLTCENHTLWFSKFLFSITFVNFKLFYWPLCNISVCIIIRHNFRDTVYSWP